MDTLLGILVSAASLISDETDVSERQQPLREERRQDRRQRAQAALIRGDDCPREHTLQPTHTTLERQWRLSLYSALQQQGATMLWRNVCDLSDIFQSGTLRVLDSSEKLSTSKSIIIMGALKPPTNVPLQADRRDCLDAVWQRIKCDIVIKVSFPRTDEYAPRNQVRSLDAEALLYRFAGELVDVNVTPNLVLGLASWKCTYGSLDAASADDSTALAALRNAMQAVYDDYNADEDNAKNQLQLTADDPLRFLVLERGRGASLYDMLSAGGKIDEPRLMSIVFQLLYTLDCLNRRLVRHGDLHAGNVFVDQLSDSSTTLAYLPYLLKAADDSDDVWFAVPTRGLVPKIYDWDFGGVYPPAPNQRSPRPAWPMPPEMIENATARSLCNEYSSCGYNPKADAFTLLTSLYDDKSTRTFAHFRAFVERSIDSRLLQFALVTPSKERGDANPESEFDKAGGLHYRLCKGPLRHDKKVCDLPKRADLRVPGGKCTGPWLPDDCLMLTPAQMMLDQAFVSFRRSLRTEDPFLATPYVFGNWPSRLDYETVIPAQERLQAASQETNVTTANRKRGGGELSRATRSRK